MTRPSLLLILLVFAILPAASADVPAGTFSIVARDPATGELGVAVQSRAFNVGMAVPWARARVGAIATQAMTNESFGPNGLAMLRQGKTAPEALAALIAADDNPHARQLAIIDANGRTAQHTGKKNGVWAGGVSGRDFACQGNILAGEAVVKAMAAAFEATKGELSERLLAALVAGQAAGGDRRGKQSAALLVVRPSRAHPEYESRYVDLRVDDDPEPIKEIIRLYRILEGTDLVQAHLRYAADYRKAGKKKAAELEFRRVAGILDGALGRKDTAASTLNGIAWFLAIENLELEKALTAAERAAKLEPESFEIRDTLAECLFRLRRFDDAVREGEKALATQPDDPYLKAQLERFRNRWTTVGPGERPPPPQVVPMKRVNRSTRDLGFVPSQWLHPKEKPAEKLEGLPELLSETPVWYAANYGDSEDQTFTLVIDESAGPGTGYDTLYADLDNDNRIDVKTERIPFRMSTTSNSIPTRIEFRVTAGGREAPYSVEFTAFPYPDDEGGEEQIHANLRNSSYYVGDLTFEGRPAKIAIADLDSNAIFGDVGKSIFDGDRMFLDLDADGDFRDEVGQDLPYGGVTRILGKWYSVVVRPDGGEIRIAPASPDLGTLRNGAGVAFADLRSETQPMPVTVEGGRAEVVVGTYRLTEIILRVRDELGQMWEAEGTFAQDKRPTVTVAKGEVVALPGGAPLTIEPTLSREGNEGALEVNLVIRGAAGAIYHMSESNPTRVKPGYQVIDEKGKVLQQATFEYG